MCPCLTTTEVNKYLPDSSTGKDKGHIKQKMKGLRKTQDTTREKYKLLRWNKISTHQ